MSPKAERRMDRWSRGEVQHPMHFADRCDFAPVTWIRHDAVAAAALDAKLKAIDKGFEIIYDKSTARDGFSPAHHLYRVTPGGCPSDDSMVIEFSLTEGLYLGCPVPWQDSIAKAPGDWVLDVIARTDKAKLPGNEEQVERGIAERREIIPDAQEKAAEKEIAETSAREAEEAEPYLMGRIKPEKPKAPTKYFAGTRIAMP